MLFKKWKGKSHKAKAISGKKDKSWLSLTFLSIVYCLLPIASTAQCAMCRASLESTGDKGKVEAINDGIVFLMAIPYILAAVIGFVIYKMYYKKG